MESGPGLSAQDNILLSDTTPVSAVVATISTLAEPGLTPPRDMVAATNRESADLLIEMFSMIE